MSLKSRSTILNEAANADGASNEAILMAALNESQEEYKRLSVLYLQEMTKLKDEIQAIREAMEASNKQKAIDVQEALQTASEAVLSDLRTDAKNQMTSLAASVKIYEGEVKTATADLRKAREKKEKNDNLEMLKFFGGAFIVIVSAFYVALLLYGWWYDIPEAVGKMDVLNNGIYQLLRHNGLAQ